VYTYTLVLVSDVTNSYEVLKENIKESLICSN